MNMQTFEVGKSYREALGHEESVMFDVTDSGVIIPIYFRGPREDEIQQFKSGEIIRMAYVAKNNVLIIMMKFGNLDWMDAPYTPYFSKNLTHLPDEIPADEGLTAHLLIFDTESGVLKTQRIFSLRERMSTALINEINEIKKKPFSLDAYNADLRSAYRFTTSQLLRQAKMVYRIQ